jgi:hypothetical protein
VVGRVPPAPCPREPAAGQPVTVLRWLRPRGGAAREGHGGWHWAAQRSPVRLVAAQLTPTTTPGARRRAHRKAPKAGRPLPTPPLAVAGGLWLIPTRAAGPWSTADVLYSYRARWHVARGCKTMQPWLRLHQMRSTHRPSGAATVRARRGAGALHEDTTTQLRTLFRATAPPQTRVVSRWLVSGLGLDTLRQQGPGRWSAARRWACLPRLRRVLCARLWQRVHQDSTGRTWLEHRAPTHSDRRHKVA